MSLISDIGTHRQLRRYVALTPLLAYDKEG